MQNSTDEIQELIKQLKDLQLQQTDILARLERARAQETDTRVGVDEGTNGPVDHHVTQIPIDEERDFVIGDRVRIVNPNRFQTDKGIITKIGHSRITVQTRSGGKIQRAPKNLVLDIQK